MAERRYDIELAALNQAHALDLTPAKILTWDPLLWRGPRLLVPLTVEVLVVNAQSAAGPWAKVKLEITAEDTPPREPEPFETYDHRAPGVHLHWALPDGLTRGTQPKADEEAPPEGSAGAPSSEQPESPQPAETSFPLIPDRWLVVRMYPGNSPKAKRRAAAWVIESEQADPARRVTPLSQWQEDRGEARDPRWLTALGLGDPAFAAYYDNVQNILGFHDALTDVPAGPLSYLVVGWYSEATEDPLHQPTTREGWFALLDHLGWTLQDGAEERLNEAAREARSRLEELGLEARYDPEDGARVGVVTEGLEMPRPPGEPVIRAGRERTRRPAPGEIALGRELPAIHLNPALSAVASASLETLATFKNVFANYWPRQMICHGMIYDVEWNRRGGSYRTNASGVPPAGSVDVALGDSASEALAAAIAERRGDANLEKILAAFHYGMLGQLRDPDGLAALESLLHSERFASKPGGFVVDIIEQGDLFARGAESEAAGSEPPPPRFESPAGYEGVGRYGVNLAFVKKRFTVTDLPLRDLVAETFGSSLPGDEPPEGRERRKVPVRRGMPRYWEPRDPAVLVIQAGRSYKHGEDGRFDEQGRLVCRLSGEPIKSVNPVVANVTGRRTPVRATITAAQLTADPLQSGQLPEEVAQLYAEALLLDETTAPIAANALLEEPSYLDAIAPPGRTTRHDLSSQSIEQKVRVEQTLLWNAALDPALDAQALTAISGLAGKAPSLVGLQPWRPPWTPLHVEWEVQWFPSADPEGEWELEENDYDLRPGSDMRLERGPRAVYKGRTLLTPGVGAVLSARVRKFLEEETAGPAGAATGQQERAMKEVIRALAQIDVLGSSLEGVHGLMIGREEKHRLSGPDEDVPSVEDTSQPTGAAELFPIRAGHLRLSRLRIVDAFGQIYDVDAETLSRPVRSEGVRFAAHADLLRLPPRIVQPSRLMFRFLSARSDSEEATKERSPVCGWLVPDHLDEALEIYDAEGVSQGQVQLKPDGSALEWQGVPGFPSPLGGRAQVENMHLRRFIEGLLSMGIRDSEAGVATPERSESALSALLRMIDATLWTVDPLGREGGEHLSVLVGRPLTLVRAQLQVETEGEPVMPEMMRTALAVRLGALTRLQDGLMGYFVNDDYTRFHPVHEEIASQARPSRPREGFLGPVEGVPAFFDGFATSASRVVHPYIGTAPTLELRPLQKVLVTLVIDPRGGVHATSGFSPRKRIDLLREHVAPALEALTLTFRAGPVLTDPVTIRMPLPAEIRGGWSWVRRTGAAVWQEDPIVHTADDAKLPDRPAQIAEGWLKLSSALSPRSSGNSEE